MRPARAPAAALALAASLAIGAEPPLEPPDAPEPDPAGAAAPSEPWTLVSSRPIVIRTRARPGTRVHEIWASGLLDAPAEFVQDVILDGESYPKFMPYVKEVRALKLPTTDGSFFTYQRVAPPLVAVRDVVLHVWVEASLDGEGSHRFRNRWEAVPGVVPHTPGAVRTLLSNGSWEVWRLPNGQCRAIYRFIVDPGGNIPSWLADLGNRTGIPDLYKAVEKEARRRAALPRPPPKAVAVEAPPAPGEAPDASSPASP